MDRLTSLASAHTAATSRRSQAYTEWLNQEKELDAAAGIKYQKFALQASTDRRISLVALNVIFG